MQNISFAYYDDVKDQKEFRLTKTQTAEIDRLTRLLWKSRRKLPYSNLKWSRVPIIFEDVIDFIMLGWDSPDAIHASIARAEECNIFVTRDKDFLKRKKTLKPYFDIKEPHEAVKKIGVTTAPPITLREMGG